VVDDNAASGANIRASGRESARRRRARKMCAVWVIGRRVVRMGTVRRDVKKDSENERRGLSGGSGSVARPPSFCCWFVACSVVVPCTFLNAVV